MEKITQEEKQKLAGTISHWIQDKDWFLKVPDHMVIILSRIANRELLKNAEYVKEQRAELESEIAEKQERLAKLQNETRRNI